MPDPDDRHVLDAAIRGRAGVVVTYNLTDLPAPNLLTFGTRAEHPDDLTSRLLDADAEAVCDEVRRQRHDLRRQPTVDRLLATFAQHRLPRTVERLRPFVHVL